MKKQTVKTSISISEQVDGFAQELMKKWGYDNFSAFVAELIRREKQRDQEREAALRKPTVCPPQRDETRFVEERRSKLKRAA